MATAERKLTSTAEPERRLERWLKKLGKELDDRQAPLKKFANYHDGKQEMVYASPEFEKHFGPLFNDLSDNFCQLVIKTQNERLTPEGFRMGASENQEADKDAWRIWQTNHLDARSKLAHSDALVKGESYALAWPGAGPLPRIFIEDALQMAVHLSPEDPRVRLAALKRWKDVDSGRLMATLYLPEAIYKFQSTTTSSTDGVQTEWPNSLLAGKWERREGSSEAWPLKNPFGVVPVVPLANDPHLSGAGRSELLNVIPKQNAINAIAANMLLAAETTAFRQRWATGVKIPIDPETGEEIETFEYSLKRLWHVEDEKATFGDFAATDLAPYVKAVEMWIQHLATTTRTPPHYLMGSMGSFPSGESLRAAETGLVAKARDAMVWFGEAWEEVMRLCFHIMGDEKRATAVDAETIWRNPETRTEAEVVDAALKKSTLGVPFEQLMEDIGYTQTQIRRMTQQRSAATFQQAIVSNPRANVIPLPVANEE